ncbi:MAG TPA: ATP-binding protein, partial [Bacteroidales bacterium]|nr:ATP-binding protein [Bacteroidales bacterium]
LLITVLLIILNYSRKSSQSQSALKQAKTEADNLVKAKELFTANVSHELRTPMNAIYGLTEQLLQQPMESKLTDQLRVILKSADYLNKVVNDILDFSKIQAGKLSIEQISFNLPEVFREVCALNQVIATQKKLDFRCNFSDNIPSYVIGDPTRLRQILLNLLNNAFKFTERGYVSISAETKTSDETSATISITIADTGIGIPSDKLDKIFDDYTQAEQSVSRKYGGTGLGLSIVKRLMDLMQGSIKVSSVEHQGTTFTCNIPFALSNVEEIHETDHAAAVVVPTELHGISVLVADDEEYNRMLLTTIFNKWNFKFRCVSNGQDAVQLMYDNYFDIVLMDIRMPGMNGFEATREILETLPNSRIIALSAGNSPDDIKRCKEAGMIDFLLKPFSERDLLSILVKTIDGCALPPVKEVSPVNIPVENDEIRLEELYKVSAGDEHFIEEMLTLFLKTTHDGIEKLNLYYKESDWEGISNTAHKMASPCRHLGVMNLYRNLKELESMENNTADLSRAKTLIDSVQRQVSTITSQIEQRIVLSTK